MEGDRRPSGTGHSYSDEWSFNQDNHWHATTCGHNNTLLRKDVEGHSWDDDGICKVCGYDSNNPSTASTLSEGSVWIIVAVTGAAAITLGILVAKKKKESKTAE